MTGGSRDFVEEVRSRSDIVEITWRIRIMSRRCPSSAHMALPQRGHTESEAK